MTYGALLKELIHHGSLMYRFYETSASQLIITLIFAIAYHVRNGEVCRHSLQGENAVPV